ncbi:unnamed protein product [Gongylonema pulchrum]|uniref:Uncharacterized protein n=1 Tax=Gongylonema pulchrum TaxID=637853 RepID=A0A183DX93_9BILA|nr:unnamed protein product [Gongylonema pulchrum]
MLKSFTIIWVLSVDVKDDKQMINGGDADYRVDSSSFYIIVAIQSSIPLVISVEKSTACCEDSLPIRTYDPIIVAAANQQNLRFMLPPPTYQMRANAYIRKRSSLVEALSNSLFSETDDNDDDDEESVVAPVNGAHDCAMNSIYNDNNNVNRMMSKVLPPPSCQKSSLQVEQVYSVKRVTCSKVTSLFTHLIHHYRRH